MFWCTGCRVTHYHSIDLHGFNILGSILKTFTLLEAAGGGSKIHCVCTKPFLRQFETEPGAGGILEKQINNGYTLERWNFFNGSIQNFTKIKSRINNCLNIIAGISFKTK